MHPCTIVQRQGVCTKLLGTLSTAQLRILFTRQRPEAGQQAVYIPQGGQQFTTGKCCVCLSIFLSTNLLTHQPTDTTTYEKFSKSPRHQILLLPKNQQLKQIQAASYTCTLTVDLEGQESDVASWLDVWAAAAAINVMCIKKGLAGGSSMEGRIFFSSRSAPLECCTTLSLITNVAATNVHMAD